MMLRGEQWLIFGSRQSDAVEKIIAPSNAVIQLITSVNDEKPALGAVRRRSGTQSVANLAELIVGGIRSAVVRLAHVDWVGIV
jgi:hypothetical protein